MTLLGRDYEPMGKYHNILIIISLISMLIPSHLCGRLLFNQFIRIIVREILHLDKVASEVQHDCR